MSKVKISILPHRIPSDLAVIFMLFVQEETANFSEGGDRRRWVGGASLPIGSSRQAAA